MVTFKKIWIKLGTIVSHNPTQLFYAVVTPLRKAASYEQRKTNLGSSP